MQESRDYDNRITEPCQPRQDKIYLSQLMRIHQGLSEVILDNSFSTQNQLIIIKTIQSTSYLFIYNKFPTIHFILIYPHLKYSTVLIIQR